MHLFRFLKDNAIVIVTSLMSAITGILIASNTTMFQAETNFSNEVMLQIMNKRIETYPDVYRITLELSSYRPEKLTLADGVALGHQINTWLYGNGGLFANCLTREIVSDIRSKLIKAKTENELNEALSLIHI